MRAGPALGLGVAVLAATILAGVALPASAQFGDSRAVAPSEQESPTTDNGTALLTRAELFEAIGGNASDHSADLYYVADNGTWYRAYPNGSVGQPAPDADEVARIEAETYEVPRDERPTYVWKVLATDECSTTFYDGTDASEAAAYPVPGCPSASPPTPTNSPPEGTTPPDGGETVNENGNGSGIDRESVPAQSGLGVIAAISGVLLASWLLIRE